MFFFRNYFARLAAVGAGLLIAQNLLAQTDSTQTSLDEVVVTAERKKSSIRKTAYAVSLIKKPALTTGNNRTLPEALSAVNGVFVQKTNHGGGSPIIRGLMGNQVLVVVDGIRLNNATFRYGPNQYLNTIDAFTAQQVEVVRGTGSVQYGSDALGGAVHILTGQPRFKEKPSADGNIIARYATAGMEKTGRATGTYSSENFALQAGATVRNFGDLIGGDTTGKQTPSGYKEAGYDLKAAWRVRDGITLIVAHQWLQQRHVPVYHKIKLEGFDINEMNVQQRSLSYARLQTKSRKPIFEEQEFTLYTQQSKEGRRMQKTGSTTLRQEQDEVHTVGLNVNNRSRFSAAWTANTGLEWYKDEVESSRQDINSSNGSAQHKRGLYPDGSSFISYALYHLQQLQLKKWILSAGLRYNGFDVHMQDSTVGAVAVRPNAVVGNAAIMYVLPSGHNIYTSFSSGFRAPNVDDLGSLGIVDFRYELPAPHLKPERSYNYELGYKFSRKKVDGSIAVYQMQLSNLINRIRIAGERISGYDVYVKQNSGRAWVRGFEIESRYQVDQNVSLAGSVTYTNGQDLSRNEPLRRIPPLHGRLQGNYKLQAFSIHAECLLAAKQTRLAQGDKEDNRIPAGGTPGWRILNLSGSYTWKSLNLQLNALNIFNQDYRTHGSGINGVGRSLWATVSVDF